MAQVDPQVLLKILSGPNVGAELELKDGIYILGSDPECDIILMDSMVSPRHLRLTVKGRLLTLEPIEGATYIEGKEIQGKTENVPLYAFITIGSTHWVIGDAGKTWPKISIAEAPSFVEMMGGKEKPKEATVVIEGQAVTHEEAEKKAIAALDLLPYKLKVLFYSVGGVLLFIIFISLLRMIAVEREAAPSVSQQKIDYLQSALYSYNQANNLQVSGEQGRIVVSGYLKTNRELQIISNMVNRYDKNIIFNVYSEENLVNAVEQILSEANLPVVAKPGNTLGEVIASGFVFIRERWLSTKANILLNVKGLKTLTDHVIDGSTADKVVQEVIWQNGLGQYIKAETKIDRVLVAGYVSQDIYNQWLEALNIINNRLFNSVPFEDDIEVITYANNEGQFFDFPIESVNINKPGWIAFQNGQRFFEGTTLSNGYIIKSISSDGIILTRGNNEVIIKLETL